ncbi:MAG: CtpF protein [Candidatus Liberibacter europaeus]|uniref:CtpF protein n=1 Tax=Candidatus Liberibacter europaeus TaxID=744859 RepID=A0A2T4VYH0_9HYPH|nr:CtpF protein [Candidatus Liberibacter europaeus]PTL86829.1 MAG: CtpF protein [Candidatus Liberibacter europaeus]
MSTEYNSDRKSGTKKNSDSAFIKSKYSLPGVSVHAFCITDTLCSVVEKSKIDPKMSQISITFTKGSIAEAVSMFSNSATPDLIIVQTKLSPGEILQSLGALADVCDSNTKVIVIGDTHDVTLYKELIANGVSEYLIEPLSVKDLIGVIGKIFEDNTEEESFGQTISFIGSKGGVGSSTIAHNCAFSIASIFARGTVLADLDLPYGTVNINFDRDPIKGISDAIYASGKVDKVFIDQLLLSYTDNLSLLTAPSMLDRTYDFDSDVICRILDILQRSCPFTIIDMPHLWNHWTRDILVSSDTVVITTTLDLPGLRNSKNLIDVLKRLRPNDKPPYLILNQVGMPKRPEISIDDFCGSLGVESSLVIPFDSAIFGIAANYGKMICDIYPKSSITKMFSNFIHIITDSVTIDKSNQGIYGKIRNFFKRK